MFLFFFVGFQQVISLWFKSRYIQFPSKICIWNTSLNSSIENVIELKVCVCGGGGVVLQNMCYFKLFKNLGIPDTTAIATHISLEILSKIL